MCGRFAAGDLTQAQMLEIVEGFLSPGATVDDTAEAPKGGYHIRPTNRIALVVQQGDAPQLTSANWQITPTGGRGLINAKIENNGFWKDRWENGRCMIPAVGYFEWSTASGRKEPMFITVKRNAPVLFFAGFRSQDGQGCVILTREPSPQIAHIHNRMPVILTPDQMSDWVSGHMDVATAQDVLGTGWDGRFDAHRIKPLTNDAEGESVIEPYAPPQASFEF
ncbi:MAG: SOS response-associated peptidase [Roseovarius sp.]